MITSVSKLKRYCSDYEHIENYKQAKEDLTQIWICHHRDEVKILPSGIKVVRTSDELKECGRYYHCPANELIFLTHDAHGKIHNKGTKHSEQHNHRVSKALKHRINSEFGQKFYDQFHLLYDDNKKLYHTEYMWYKKHGKCRWE